MLLRLAAVLLALNLCGMLFSLWCALFGPPWGIVFGTAGFLVGVFFMTVFGNRKRGQLGPGEPRPSLSQHAPALRGLRRPLGVLMVVLVCGAVLGIAGMVCASRMDGVTDYPVFEERASYELGAHGRHTQVSRLRYVVVGTSFFVGWHSFAALLSVLSLYIALFGEFPGWLKKQWGDV
jgi:hypothetical protein